MTIEGPWRAEVGRVTDKGEWIRTVESHAFFSEDEAFGHLFVLSAKLQGDRRLRARVRRVENA